MIHIIASFDELSVLIINGMTSANATLLSIIANKILSGGLFCIYRY